MTEYSLEPLVITLNAPKGNYEVTVSVKSHCDTVFSVFEESAGFVTEDKEITNGANTDIIAASVEAYIDCINKFKR